MQQPKHENAHNRKQFQIDRIAFFSDAVIAIAITLMVLEIKIPPLGANTPLADILKKYKGAFIIHAAALFICFFTIGRLWMLHHKLYEHIIDYNERLIKRNLYFLLTVILLPACIGFLFEEGSPMQLKLLLFFSNLAACNLSYYCMLVEIFHQKNNFSSLSDRREISKSKQNSLLVVIVFAAAIILVLLNVSWFYVPFIVGPSIRLLKRIYTRLKNIFEGVTRNPAAVKSNSNEP